MSCVSTRQMSWLSTRHMSCVSTLRYAQCSQPTQRRRPSAASTKGGAAFGRPPLCGFLCVGCEHWAYLSVEMQDMCFVERQDICLVETQDMCCVGSLDKKEAFPKSLKREVNIAFDNHFEVTLGGILVAKGAWTNWPIHILVTLADSN